MDLPHTQYLRIHITSTGAGWLGYCCSGFRRGSGLPAVSQDILNGGKYASAGQKGTSTNEPSCLRKRKIRPKDAMLLAEMLAAIT